LCSGSHPVLQWSEGFSATAGVTSTPLLPDMALRPHGRNGLALAGHGAEAVRDAITRTIVSFPEQLTCPLQGYRG
jgi:hypothetical protein